MKIKEYKIKKTKDLVKKLKPYWKEAMEEEGKYYKKLTKIQKRAARKTKIEGLEFFIADGGVEGIGNADTTMELIRSNDFAKNKGEE